MPLYVTETECAELVLGAGKDREWKALAQVWEGQGLPAIDPQTGARYWPAVKAWLDRRYNLRDDPPATPDGVEKPWTTGPRKRRVLSSEPTRTASASITGGRPQH
jgi:hypothetical protein